MIDSSIVSGVPWNDSTLYGIATDTRIPNNDSAIGSVTVEGRVVGTNGFLQHFGIVASQVGSVTASDVDFEIPSPGSTVAFGNDNVAIHVLD